jgi:hypothetical protein
MPVIPATQREMREITIQGQPGQKVSKTPSQTIAGHGGMCLSSQENKRLYLSLESGLKFLKNFLLLLNTYNIKFTILTFFFAVLGFELRACTLSYSISPFCGGFF